MLYLDNSATTPVHPLVLKVMTDVLEKYFGNPSSLHQKGLEAEKLLRKSREVVANSLGVSPQEIYFTSGGTEGDNLAIKGIAWQYRNRGRHVITSQIEHPAVRESCKQLEQQGFEVTYLAVDKLGFVDPADLVQAIRKDTILVSIMHVNNEVGSIQPVKKIGEIVKNYPRIFFHVDGVQGFAKVPWNIDDWGIDLYTISGHKLNGPKGVGAIYIKKGIGLFPLLAGGGQEYGMRSGTENVAGIVGFAKACQISREIFVGNQNKMEEVRKQWIELLKSHCPQVIINGPLGQGASPYILNISIPGLKGEVLVHALEKDNIFVSTGSACSSKTDITSPVLEAMGLAKDIKMGSIRVSFSYKTDKKDGELFVQKLKKAIQKLSR